MAVFVVVVVVFVVDVVVLVVVLFVSVFVVLVDIVVTAAIVVVVVIIIISHRNLTLKIKSVCVFIPSPIRVGTLLIDVPRTPIGASFLEFELKPTRKDSADPTQHEIKHHIV